MEKRKYRRLTEELLKEISEKYIQDKRENNISSLAKQYGIPYSVLRRRLTAYLEREGLDEKVMEEYLPADYFSFLKIGDTYQHDEHLSTWVVVEKRRVDGAEVFVLKITKKRGKRHWIRNKLVQEE